MAQNPYSTTPRQVSDYAAVTPSDTVFLSACAIGLYCSAPGNAVLVSPQGSTITVALVAGQFLRDFQFVRVNATGTTATVIGLF